MMRRNKYGARKTLVGGVKFDSKAEAKRWAELQLLFLTGEIRNLRRQVEYPLFATGRAEPISKLIVDFDYFERDIHVCDDTKGMTTPDWALRAKMFMANYPGQQLRVNGAPVLLSQGGRLVTARKLKR